MKRISYKYPNVINAYIFSQPFNYGWELQRGDDGKFRPARPISAPTLRERCIIAWCVFTGRYDALDWTMVESVN